MSNASHGLARQIIIYCVERYRSGQTGQTVNLLAYAFEGSNPSLSTNFFIPKPNRRCSVFDCGGGFELGDLVARLVIALGGRLPKPRQAFGRVHRHAHPFFIAPA